MKGELISVWSETWREIWQPLINQPDVPNVIFSDLYRELVKALAESPDEGRVVEIVASSTLSQEAFQTVTSDQFSGERALAHFFEEAHSTLNELGGDVLSNDYLDLLRQFLLKYSLRYDLRSPCQLCPNLPGMFASLFQDLQNFTASDNHLNNLMTEFEESLRDLRGDTSDGRIKTTIQKQVNVLEALGSLFPGVTNRELGKICNQVTSWPHATVSASLLKLYGFASDYPGIRHGGNPNGVLKQLDMRDLIAMSVLLTGFTPYLRGAFDPQTVHRGS